MPPGADPVTEVRLVKLNDPDAPFSIVEGVLDAGRGWGFKWTLDHARFELIVGDVKNSDLFLRYSLDPTTLRDRGPVKIMIAVNGKTVDAFTSDSVEGVHEHRRAADSFKPPDVQRLELSLTVEPPWIAPDGKRLGVYVDEIGFVPRR
jgi:hypothetical protein